MPEPESPPARHRETKKALRAGISSGIATAADGLAYQALLILSGGQYGVAAFVGALFGAWCNFYLNRRWVFDAASVPIQTQLVRYAVMSALTFAGLRSLLWLWVEVLSVNASIAWLPAKALAFVAISYPLQRLWVFDPAATARQRSKRATGI